MKDGFLKVAAITATIHLNDIQANVDDILAKAKAANKAGAKVICFQEMAVTGYSLQDMFAQSNVLEKALDGIRQIKEATKDLDSILVVSFPFAYKGKVYDAAAVIFRGKILGIPLKSYLPNYNEFYDVRYFAPSFDKPETVALFGESVWVGPKLLFQAKNFPELILGVEICEDVWVPNTPSTLLCQAGATLIVNPSASNEFVGKESYRKTLLSATSGRLIAGYVYVGTGEGESSGDVVYSATSMILENGRILASTNDFVNKTLLADIDFKALAFHRRKMNTYGYVQDPAIQVIPFSFETVEETDISDRVFSKSPYLDKASATLDQDLSTVFECQVHGLIRRLQATRAKDVVIGVSGGLDSALALLVCYKAFQELNLPLSGIHAFSMPAFATTKRTRSNSEALCQALGVSFREVDITETVKSHLKDLRHPLDIYDAAYENAQARCRTYLLMDSANMVKGLVVGTGDLSEIALGWATYNGDQMSMYNVNASVPKTVVKEVVRLWAKTYRQSNPVASKTLLDILATPISPELVPSKSKDTIGQVTEDIIGPYELHDFFLYAFLRQGYSPLKILRVATQAFKGQYDKATIAKWLAVFFRRFFSSQFKRSAAPDGVKVGSVSLSQRGDLRMPSDLGNKDFLKDLDAELAK